MFLAVPKLYSSTGANMANEVAKQLKRWNLTNSVKAMGFDTTSSNTGKKNGACTILQEVLGRNLLYLACRHHIYELVVAGTFVLVFGKSTSPTPPILVQFKNTWSVIDKTKREAIPPRIFKGQFLATLKKETVLFLKDLLGCQAAAAFPRDDYKELAELCLLVLGEKIDINIKPPGACHHARWMSKIIYVFKMYIFRRQFCLAPPLAKGLQNVCIFYAVLYVKAWFTSPLASEAAVNDLNFWKKLTCYKKVNRAIAEKALEKLQNHLWYLSPELVPMAMFSHQVSVEEKRKFQEELAGFGKNYQFAYLKYFFTL
jgi:hypothetical protein